MDASASPPIHRSIGLADGAVNLLEWPDAGPSVHFTHANGFNAETYVPILSPLAGEAHLFASDLRGHGFTALPADPERHSSWLTYPADLVRVLDAIGAGPYVLAGHSMGATTSLIAAANRPDLARAVILFEPVARSMPRSADFDLESMPLIAMTKKRRRVFPDAAMARRAYHGRGAFQTWSDDQLDAYLRGGLKPDPEGVRLACDPLWETQNYRLGPSGINEAVPRVQCPIMVFTGTEASTTGDDFVELVRRHHPSAHIQLVEGATHFLPMERPDLVRSAIRAAIRS